MLPYIVIDIVIEKVERMDKAVLVELSNALGGLVQSMYIEREFAKQVKILFCPTMPFT